jgi:hypothetical protein
LTSFLLSERITCDRLGLRPGRVWQKVALRQVFLGCPWPGAPGWKFRHHIFGGNLNEG